LLHSHTADVPGFPRRTRSNKQGAEGHTEKDITERTRPDLATEPVLVTHTKLHSSQEDRSHCHALASSKLSPDRQLSQISCCSCSYLDLPWEPSAGPAMQVLLLLLQLPRPALGAQRWSCDASAGGNVSKPSWLNVGAMVLKRFASRVEVPARINIQRSRLKRG
jgi:hypothetical protein